MKTKQILLSNVHNIIMPTPNTKQANVERMAPKFSNDKPTPLDFDMFIPWICRQWQVPTIVKVTRMYQEKYVKEDKHRSGSTQSKSTKITKYGHEDCNESNAKRNINIHPVNPATAVTRKGDDQDLVIPLIVYYDGHGNLVEISLIGCNSEIHKKIIQAINICIPFHSLLNKLTISKGGVSYPLLCELSKLLPHSNLTEICLDNSYVPKGNYYVLLDNTSQLKCLSLNRCHINDVSCIEIGKRIDFLGPAHLSLVVLQLGSNLITDIGAEHLGNVLRRNRRLLHLNLSDNIISDVGMGVILKHLMEFKLSAYERFDTARRRMDYSKNKCAIFEKYMNDVKQRQKSKELSTMHLNKKRVSLKSNKSSIKSKKNTNLDEGYDTELIEDQVKEMMAEYEDPFNTVKKDGCHFCVGNMVLCSLNVGYNELTYASVKLLDTVLNYQSYVIKPNHTTGLIRTVLDGNYIPEYCYEYERIAMNLKRVVNGDITSNTLKRNQSAVKNTCFK